MFQSTNQLLSESLNYSFIVPHKPPGLHSVLIVSFNPSFIPPQSINQSISPLCHSIAQSTNPVLLHFILLSCYHSIIPSLNHQINQLYTLSLYHLITQLNQSINSPLLNSITLSLHHSIKHSINSPFNHSITQSTNQLILHSITPSLNQSIDQFSTQPLYHSITQSTKQTLTQSLNHSFMVPQTPLSAIRIFWPQFIVRLFQSLDRVLSGPSDDSLWTLC